MTTRHPLCHVLNEQPGDHIEINDEHSHEYDNGEALTDDIFDETHAEEPETWQFEPAICG